MIAIRRARPSDAASIGAVHVAAWRSAYPGILPDGYLARLSAPRQAAYYDNAIRSGVGVHVAAASGLDIPGGGSTGAPRVVGFVTGDRARNSGIGDGEIETLYILDDWRDRGRCVTPGGVGLPFGVLLGSTRQPKPLVLPTPRWQAGGGGEHSRGRLVSRTDRFYMGPHRAFIASIAASFLRV